MAGVPAGDELAVGEEEVEAGGVKEEAGEEAARAAGVLEFDMFMDYGLVVVDGVEAVGVDPFSHRAIDLGIGEAVEGVEIMVVSVPFEGDGADPHGKVGLGTFLEGVKLVNLHIEWGRGEAFEDACIAVKVSDGREGGVNGEFVVKSRH